MQPTRFDYANPNQSFGSRFLGDLRSAAIPLVNARREHLAGIGNQTDFATDRASQPSPPPPGRRGATEILPDPYNRNCCE